MEIFGSENKHFFKNKISRKGIIARAHGLNGTPKSTRIPKTGSTTPQSSSPKADVLKVVKESRKSADIKKENLLEDVIQAVQGVVFRFERIRKGEIQFLFVSKGIEDLTGITVRAFRSNSALLFKSIHKEDRETFFPALKISEERNIPFFFEYRGFHEKEQCFKWYKIFSKPKKTADGKVFWDGTITEITREKQLERDFQEQREELSKVNFELDRLVYSTSHDLRAPIASVLGLINIIKEEFKEESLLNYLSLAEKSVFKLDKIIRNILLYSKNKHTGIVKNQIDFEDLISSVLNNLCPPGKINFNLKINQLSPVFTDNGRLNLILESLVSNAIKYSDPEKKSYIKIFVNTDKEKVKITIKDNGIGIQTDYLERIFDMFVRATEKSDGAGLGLYIARETVRKLGGTIEVKSQIKKGSVFFVTLPNMDK